MAIATHKMLADNEQVNNARMAYKDSNGAHTKHYFRCLSDSTTEFTDAISGVEWDKVNNGAVGASAGCLFSDSQAVGTAATATNAQRFGIKDNTADTPWDPATGSWAQPASADVVMMIAGRSVQDPVDGTARNGFFTFGIGTRKPAAIDSNDGRMRVSPYFTSFFTRTDTEAAWKENVATPYSSDMQERVTGQDYVFAGVKRTNENILEHYIDGEYSSTSQSILDFAADLQTSWNDWQPTATADFTHAGYLHINWCDDSNTGQFNQTDPDTWQEVGFCRMQGTQFAADGSNQFIGAFNPDNYENEVTGGTDEYPQDFYFVYIGVFENGAPPKAVIERAMTWMLAEAKAGNKVISPELISYT